MRSLARPLAAEALGTFLLVFVGVAATMANNYPLVGFNIFGIAIAVSLAYGLAVTLALPLSGGHVNPAVTVGMFVVGRINAKRAGLYIAAQLIGAVLGALAVKTIYPANITSLMSVGTPAINSQVSMMGAICLEALMTFFLTSAFFATIVSPKATRMGGFGVGLTVLVMALAGAPLTGAVMDPARAFGPALIAGLWTGHLAYWIGPILGAVIAALAWDKFLLKGE